MSWIFEPECRPKCRSKRHALEFHSAISKGSLKEVKAYARLCHNVTQIKDTVGRSALHVAAACGKLEVVEWLLEVKNGDLTEKDSESGWTALHRAVFYGQIPVMRHLIQHGSDLYSRDHEGMSPLDILMKDRPKKLTYDLKEPNEVYVWGDNSNFNLGHASGQSRSSPEVIDEFKRTGVSMKDMVLCKYHTVFLTQSGQVYTCGHGHGGRLGQENELTCVVPKWVKTVSHETCVQIAASRDHTVMLMESGAVYSCGLNDFHQLGQLPPPDKCVKPRQMSLKGLKGKKIIGVCVGRFHSVVYTACTVYTFGLNAGQLGHQKGEKIQTQPRMVSALSHKDIVIRSITSSDAATVCLTKEGEIFVLHEYLCRRIASKWVNVSKMLVYGGKLDHKMDADMLREKGGSELHIALLNSAGRLFIWRESSPTLHRCHWAIKRQLIVVDFVFSHATVAFITEAGEGFIGHWSNKKQAPPKEQVAHKKNVDSFEKSTLVDLLRDDIEIVQVVRIPNIHRGTCISADRKNSNYMVLQALPNGCLFDLPSVSCSVMGEHFLQLFEEADEYDAIHDIVVQAGNQSWPCHKYILVSHCDFFRNKVAKLPRADDSDIDDVEDEAPRINVPDVPTEIMEQILKYIYTDTCDLLKVGSKFDPILIKGEGHEKGQGDAGFEIKKDNSDILISENLGKISAFEVYQKKKQEKVGQKEKLDPNNQSKNPIRYLQEVARQLGVKGLSKRLEAVKYVNGFVQSNGKQIAPAKVKFDRSKLPELYDVSIEAEDGTAVPCHKCVLVARLEYFHSMLGSGWIETSNSTSLTLPVPADVLSILLDYLYNDGSIGITDCQHAELLCNILMVADQLLVTRLKEMCEVALAALITFRNVSEILEFASVYNADQLRATCQQFITFNMGALLEGRYLDVLSENTIDELRDYYRKNLSCMSRRIITPYSGAPERDFLEALAAKYQDDSLTPGTDSTKKNKPKKRRSRNKSTSEDADKVPVAEVPVSAERQISICSDVSIEELRGESEEKQDKEEKQHGEIDSKTESVDPRPTPTASIPVPSRDRSTAWGYSSPPTPQGAWGPRSPDPLESPVSPTSGVSLRDIMSQEQSSRKLRHSAEKKAPGGKLSWKDVKKQQNKAAKTIPAQPETQPAPQQKQSTCPWGSVNKVVKSFRDLMLEEKVPSVPNINSSMKSTSRSAQSPTANTTCDHMSWGLPTSRQSRSRPASQSESVPVPTSAPNPWVMSEASSPPSSSLSFSDILRDEQEQKKTLDYASKKPLSLIQMEEQAIQELLLHYKASENKEEHITVERVPRVRAAPLWSVSKQKGSASKF